MHGAGFSPKGNWSRDSRWHARSNRTRGARKNDQHGRPGSRGALDRCGSAVIVDNFTHDRQAEARTVGFAVADERIEQGAADFVRDAGAIVGYPNLKKLPFPADIDSHLTISIRSCFASVYEQINESALQFLAVKHTLRFLIQGQSDFRATKFWPNANCVNRVAKDLIQPGRLAR